MDSEKALQKIAALLRHAEGSSTDHEMLAFTEAAQRIATAMSIDIEMARLQGELSDNTQPRLVQETIELVESSSKGFKNYINLFVVIAAANDVQCDVLRSAKTVYAFGYERDIALTKQLYQSLVVQMVKSCQEFLRSGEYKKETVQVYEKVSYYGVTRTVKKNKPISTITAKLNFQSAFSHRVGQRLANAKKTEIAEQQNMYSENTSVAVVVQSKNDAVRQYYKSASQAQGRWRPSSHTYSQSASFAGDKAGKEALIGQTDQLRIGGSRPEITQH